MLGLLLFWSLSVNVQSLCNCGDNKCTHEQIKDVMKHVTNSLDRGDISELEDLETAVVTSQVYSTQNFSVGKFVSLLYRKKPFPQTQFDGLSLCASEREVSIECNANSPINVQLPKELPVDRTHRLVFNMVTLPQKAASVLVNSSDYLYNNRLVGLSVEGKSVSGLQEFVNISMNVTTSLSDSHRPQCVFLNYSTQTLDTDGCLTLWEPGQDHFVCSCNHLAFFGVLMVSNKVCTIPELNRCTREQIEDMMKNVTESLEKGDISELQDLERAVVTSQINETQNFAVGKFVVLIHAIGFSPPEFDGLSLCASEREVSTECNANVTINVQLPKELPVDRTHKLALIMVTLPQKAANVLVNSSDYLYNNRLVGLSVEKKNVSGLQEFVNISMNITTSLSDSHKPQCVFLNNSTQTLDTDGCLTLWEPGQDHFVCSCNHLTFFGVLMVSKKGYTIPELNRCTREQIEDMMKNVTESLEKGDISELQDLERAVVTSQINDTQNFAVGKFVSLLYSMKRSPPTQFDGLTLYACEIRVSTEWHANVTINVQLPKELPVDRNHSLAFNMVTLPQKAASVLVNSSDYLYNNRLVALSVEEKNLSGLQEFVNISMNITTSLSDSHRPQCVFLNYSTQTLDTDGCLTLWEPGQDHFVCSCNHLTFFGVLMVSNKVPTQLSQTDVDILTYVTFIGCGISFCALLIAVILFTVRRDVRSDVSMKIHVNLAIALLFLNMHFLPNTAVGIWRFSWPSPWLCFYLAVTLHFSLLASFSWMAVEGFHLYLLLVKVFNIHVKKYLLKVSLVGWGVPAVVVGIVVIISRDFYGTVSMSQSNSTEICYIRQDLVKQVTTLGLFSLMFLFNFITLMVAVRNIVSMRKNKLFGPNDCNRAKKDICTLLGVVTLLGTTWGLIFFSFGQLTTIGLYAFSILNPLQGLFICLWFLMFARKKGKATTTTSTETQSSRVSSGTESHDMSRAKMS